jgi:hypothetical protein
VNEVGVICCEKNFLCMMLGSQHGLATVDQLRACLESPGDNSYSLFLNQLLLFFVIRLTILVQVCKVVSHFIFS